MTNITATVCNLSYEKTSGHGAPLGMNVIGPDNMPRSEKEKRIMEKICTIEEAIEVVCGPESKLSEIYDENTERLSDIQYPFPFGLWFRGQCRATYQLIPSVFRSPKLGSDCGQDEEVWYDEGMMIQHFRQRNPSYEEGYKNPFDLLCLLQHYNFPTRLLDWTESVLIALYFAVEKDDDQDGKIFALNARRLNSQTRLHDKTEGYICGSQSIDTTVRSFMASSRRLKDLRFAFQGNHTLDAIRKINAREQSNYEKTGIFYFDLWLDGKLESEGARRDELVKLLTSPVAVFPNRLNPRMTSQLSMVLLFGGKKGVHDPVNSQVKAERLPLFVEDAHALEQLNRDAPIGFLKEFIVPRERKADIREDLRRIGMHEAALFPELDHVGNFVRKEWTFPKEKRTPKSGAANASSI